tara:strand:- start:2024 stop:2401 length:378 start_codon:yes stop_codon:yes gene_type:complete
MVIKKCLNCSEELKGRAGKVFCTPYCRSNYHYQKNKEKGDTLFASIDKQLKLNRRLLTNYNKAGKAVIRKDELLKAGFNPKYFTHYWKNQKGDVYLFCYEFGFLEKQENEKPKYVLVQWQDYMEK